MCVALVDVTVDPQDRCDIAATLLCALPPFNRGSYLTRSLDATRVE